MGRGGGAGASNARRRSSGRGSYSEICLGNVDPPTEAGAAGASTTAGGAPGAFAGLRTSLSGAPRSPGASQASGGGGPSAATSTAPTRFPGLPNSCR
eukprot:5021142-Pyramimonas_sp.AAC.1